MTDETLLASMPRRAPLRAILLAILATVASIHLLGAAPRTGFDPELVWGSFDDWEPTVAADPITLDVYQVTTRLNASPPCSNCESKVIVFRRSADGGTIWGADSIPAVTGNRQADPQIAVARDGTIFVTLLDHAATFDNAVLLVKSSDHGATWTAPIAVERSGGKIKGPDKPILVISPSGTDVYVAFNTFDSPSVYSSRVTASHDGGLTFLPSVRTNDDALQYFHWGGTVAPNGTVYLMAGDVAPDFLGEQHVDVLRSSDGGATWTTTRVDTSQESPDCSWAPNCFRPITSVQGSIAADAAGTLMLGYVVNDAPDAPYQLYVRASTDGITWSPRRLVGSTDPAVSSFHPALAVGSAAGDFHLVFQDDRNGLLTAWNTWYRRTTNGGGKWSTPVRLSDAAGVAPYKADAGYAFPYGDYLGLAVDFLGTNHVIWGEGSGVLSGGGSWYTRGR